MIIQTIAPTAAGIDKPCYRFIAKFNDSNDPAVEWHIGVTPRGAVVNVYDTDAECYVQECQIFPTLAAAEAHVAQYAEV